MRTLVVTLTIEMVEITDYVQYGKGEVPALYLNGHEVWRAPDNTYIGYGDEPNYVEQVIAETFRKVLNP